MRIEVEHGSVQLVIDPAVTLDGREVHPGTTVADITRAVVAACRALGTDEALDLARYMTGGPTS